LKTTSWVHTCPGAAKLAVEQEDATGPAVKSNPPAPWLTTFTLATDPAACAVTETATAADGVPTGCGAGNVGDGADWAKTPAAIITKAIHTKAQNLTAWADFFDRK
jgi:hypothetical protein